jgi:hypothetical protein
MESKLGKNGETINVPLLLKDKSIPKFDEGKLPSELERYKHQLPWPLLKNQTNIYLAAFHGGPDSAMKEWTHEGVDFQVKAGTTVKCIEDGYVAYARDDERGFYFGNLIIQGSRTHILYRYCHLRLDSLPWDYKTLWGENRAMPMVKAGQDLGRVAAWFKDFDPQIKLPNEVEAIYGRKRDHLHLGTAYNPYYRQHVFHRSVSFNPLLVLQKPKDYAIKKRQ